MSDREAVLRKVAGSYIFTATAYDADDVKANVSAPVTVSIADDAGTVVDTGMPTITDGVLSYSCAFDKLPELGHYEITWTGTVAGEPQVWVTGIELVAGWARLCTRDQVKTRIGITTSGTDERIDQLIEALLPKFTNRFRREFMPRVTETRTFTLTSRLVSLGASDLRAATSVVLHPEGAHTELTAGTGYVLWPLDELTGTAGHIKLGATVDIASPHSAAFGFAQVEITGEWGIWADTDDVPEDVNIAAIETVLSWMDRGSSTIGMLGGGDPREVEPVASSTWDIPTAAWRTMSAYDRPMLVV